MTCHCMTEQGLITTSWVVRFTNTVWLLERLTRQYLQECVQDIGWSQVNSKQPMVKCSMSCYPYTLNQINRAKDYIDVEVYFAENNLWFKKFLYWKIPYTGWENQENIYTLHCHFSPLTNMTGVWRDRNGFKISSECILLTLGVVLFHLL